MTVTQCEFPTKIPTTSHGRFPSLSCGKVEVDSKMLSITLSLVSSNKPNIITVKSIPLEYTDVHLVDSNSSI